MSRSGEKRLVAGAGRGIGAVVTESVRRGRSGPTGGRADCAVLLAGDLSSSGTGRVREADGGSQP